MTRAFALLLSSCCLMPAVAQDSPETITVPEETMQKLVIHKVKPLVRAETESPTQGTVVWNAIISEAGNIESLQMVSGHPMLVPAALRAVKQWRYRPYEVNGIPRAVETTIRVEFAKEGAETIASEAESPVLATAEDMRGRLIYRVGPIYPRSRGKRGSRAWWFSGSSSTNWVRLAIRRWFADIRCSLRPRWMRLRSGGTSHMSPMEGQPKLRLRCG